MENQNMPQSFQYRLLDLDRVKIMITPKQKDTEDYTGFRIVIQPESYGAVEFMLEFENPTIRRIIVDQQESISAAFNYAKDLILSGNWSKPGDQQFTWNQMKAKGFNSEDGKLSYSRQTNALAAEGALARTVISQILYRHIRRSKGLVSLSEEAHLPSNLVDVQLSSMDDIGLIKYGKELSNCRLTGQGRKYYEEHALPAHNLVFLIAPCTDMYKEIRNAYEEVAAGKEFGYSIKFQEATTTKEPTIRDDILANIRACKFIIADITGRGEIESIDADGKARKEFERFNYNCLYELGYAHAINKKLVCFVSRAMGFKNRELKLPFDFATVQFDDWELDEVEEFKEKLRKRLRDIQNQFEREY